jgi:carbonic anhydrase/acetyltransferase-like protein (isoleucine patch superfamily)
MNLCDKAPSVPPNAFIAASAAVIGDVNVGSGSSIWYGCVLRGNLHIQLICISVQGMALLAITL